MIRTGREERLVPCAVNFHTPAEGLKSIVRLDTGELIEECAMSAEECQTKIWHEPEVTIEQPTQADVAELAEQIAEVGAENIYE